MAGSQRPVRTTIYDVAKAAGVSSATVSRVFSGRDTVAPETRDKVESVAEVLGFRRNSLARNLSMRTSDAVAVLVPDISNPFFSELVKGVQSAAFDVGYTTLICNTEGDARLEKRYLDEMLSRQVEHVFTVGLGLEGGVVAEYIAAGMDLIAVDRPINSTTSTLVYSDSAQGAEAAVTHLINLGHRLIAHIRGPADVPHSRERSQGYLKALAAVGIQADDALSVASDFTEQGGENAFKVLEKRGRPFSAIFAADDVIAIGALSAARASGRKVPRDLSVVGFDDVLPARYTVPPLTTVRQDAKAMGERAVQVMTTPPSRRGAGRFVLPVSLVVRGSTGRPPKRSAALEEEEQWSD